MGKFREGERGYSWKNGAPAGFSQSTVFLHNWLRGQRFPLFYNVFGCRFCDNPTTPARPGAGRRDRTGDQTGPTDRAGQGSQGALRGAKGSQGWAPGPHPRPPGSDSPAWSPTAHHPIAPTPTPAPLRNGPDGPDLPDRIKRAPAGHTIFSEAWPWSCGHHSVGVWPWIIIHSLMATNPSPPL